MLSIYFHGTYLSVYFWKCIFSMTWPVRPLIGRSACLSVILSKSMREVHIGAFVFFRVASYGFTVIQPWINGNNPIDNYEVTN